MLKICFLALMMTCVYGQKIQQAKPSALVQKTQQPALQQVKPVDSSVPQTSPQTPGVADHSVPPVDASQQEGSSLPIPRFVALRGTSNLHVGPGKQYPVDWQYIIPNFPMEVLAEFGHWRRIRDFQGNSGWVHKSLLTGKRYVLVVNSVQNLMNTPHAQGKIVARLSPGVVGRVVQVQGDWCKLNVKWEEKNYKGWVEKRHIWGVYGHETHF